MRYNPKPLTALAFAALLVLGGRTAADDAEPIALLELFNYYEYSPQLLSSGQPTAEQFTAIKEAGVEAVINLAPVTEPGALADEGEIVRGHGMAYTHIPVNWDAPPLADVEHFLATMASYAGKRVLVHCYANARASAFVYLYRVSRAGDPEPDARADLVSIWNLNQGYELAAVPHWQAFIEQARTVFKK